MTFKYENDKNGITVMMEQEVERHVITVSDRNGNVAKNSYGTAMGAREAYDRIAYEAMKNENTFEDVSVAM